MLSYYGTPGVRDICHALKQTDDAAAYKKAVAIVSEYLSGQGVNKDCVLIPCPQHTGRAVYTKEIADRVACLTGCTVADVLRCRPHMPLYEQKKKGLCPDPMLYIDGILPGGKTLWLVDNVISTGATYTEACRVICRQLKPLAFAIDAGRVKNGLEPFLRERLFLERR